MDRAKDEAAVTAEAGTWQAGLDILKALPLSAMFDASFTQTKTAQPGTQNSTVELPQDASLFLAGGWTEHLGSFVQVTYSAADDHFSWDNTDIRYAKLTTIGGKELVWGLDLNNNPTVEDLWNATPRGDTRGSRVIPRRRRRRRPFCWASGPGRRRSRRIHDVERPPVSGGDGLSNSHLGDSEPDTGSGSASTPGVRAVLAPRAGDGRGTETQFEIGTYGLYMKIDPERHFRPRRHVHGLAGNIQIRTSRWRRTTCCLSGHLHPPERHAYGLVRGGGKRAS